MGPVAGGSPWGRGRSRRLEVLERLQELLRRVLRADLGPGLDDLAVLVDQERRADDAQVLPAVYRLLAPGAVLLGHGVVGVGEEGEAERVLVVELLLLRRLVRTDAEDLHVDLVLEERKSVV